MSDKPSSDRKNKPFSPVQYVVHRLLYTPLLGYYIYLVGIQFREGKFQYFGPYSPYFPYTTEEAFISAFWFARELVFTILTEGGDTFFFTLFGVLAIFLLLQAAQAAYQREIIEKGRGRIIARRRLFRMKNRKRYYLNKLTVPVTIALLFPVTALIVLTLSIVLLILPTFAKQLGVTASANKVKSYRLCYDVESDKGLIKAEGTCTCVYKDGKLESFGVTVDASKDYLLIYSPGTPTKLQPMEDRVITTTVNQLCSQTIESLSSNVNKPSQTTPTPLGPS